MFLVLALSLLASACTPSVGDKCTKDSECGATTGLVCDLATLSGYCTRTPCKFGECPVEATCVDFGADLRYCMRWCDPSNECRDGLTCREVQACKGANEAGASLAADPSAATAAYPCSSEAKSFCGIAP